MRLHPEYAQYCLQGSEKIEKKNIFAKLFFPLTGRVFFFFWHLFIPKLKNTARNPEKMNNEKKGGQCGAVFSKWYIEMWSKLAGNGRSQQHKNIREIVHAYTYRRLP